MKFSFSNLLPLSRIMITVFVFASMLLSRGVTAYADVDTRSSEQTASNKTDKQPKDVIEHTINEIVATVTEFPDQEDEERKRQQLMKLIEPRFDFKEMARRTLGSHWKKIEESEQDEFVKVFSELLSRTYLSHVESVKPGMVSVVDQKVRPKSNVGGFSIAIVHTDVKHKGDVFPLNYKMVQRSTGWKVYDIVIENIGLVSNYRNEFSGIIRKKGFSGLLEGLKDKIKS